MFVWLVTVRAAEGCSPQLGQILTERMLPLLQGQDGCSAPAVAACVNCAGEHTYLAYWTDRASVERFETTPAYRAPADDLAPLVRVPLKCELWQVLAS